MQAITRPIARFLLFFQASPKMPKAYLIRIAILYNAQTLGNPGGHSSNKDRKRVCKKKVGIFHTTLATDWSPDTRENQCALVYVGIPDLTT